MAKRKTITKEWLQTLGVSDVTKDGKVTYKDKVMKEYKATCKHKHGTDKTYPVISVYDPELYHEQKNAKKKDCPGIRLLLLSRVVYAWFHDICPADYDVDHIDNNPFNNHVNNLQLLTRKENLNKRLGRNNYTCHLTEDELRAYNEQRDGYKHMVAQARENMLEAKDNLRKVENDYYYYQEICKNTKQYKLLKEVKDDYKERIEELQDTVDRYAESWHYWCKQFNEFKRTHLTREICAHE